MKVNPPPFMPSMNNIPEASNYFLIVTQKNRLNVNLAWLKIMHSTV